MNLKDAIREAADERDNQTMRRSEATISNELETQKAITASSKAVKPASSKAVKSVAPKGRRVSIQETDRNETQDETAAMTVRVSRRHRLHWLISAKRQGTSLTAAITEALNSRFGEPDD